MVAPERSRASLTSISTLLNMNNNLGGGLGPSGASPLSRQGSNLKRRLSMKRHGAAASSSTTRHTLSLKV